MADALTNLQEAPPSDGAQGSGAVPAAAAMPGDSIWERIQDALKRGLISSDQYQQLATRMGYTPQNVAQTPAPGKLGGNFATGVKDPNYAGDSLAGQLGTTVGNIAGRLGKAGFNAADKAINSSGAPMDISAPAPMQPSPFGDAPSPAWNQ